MKMMKTYGTLLAPLIGRSLNSTGKMAPVAGYVPGAQPPIVELSMLN